MMHSFNNGFGHLNRIKSDPVWAAIGVCAISQFDWIANSNTSNRWNCTIIIFLRCFFPECQEPDAWCNDGETCVLDSELCDKIKTCPDGEDEIDFCDGEGKTN